MENVEALGIEKVLVKAITSWCLLTTAPRP